VLGEPGDGAWVGEQDAGVEHVGTAVGSVPRLGTGSLVRAGLP
jgi:hypothetical protein